MPHETSLIATVAMGLVLAFGLGFLASRVRLPPLVGYLLAGVAMGPFTPGFVGDLGLAGQLAEIGVILLMFGVGVHFSVGDLLAVRWIAVPGAVVQIAAATAIGAGIAMAWGWSFGAGLVLGLALSVASTVVLLRALDSRNAVETPNGRIAVGWLIVEDLAMVVALVMLPALAELLGGNPGAAHGDAAHGSHAAGGSVLLALALTFGKVALFVALIMAVGRRAVPWLLRQVARTGSRELFTLSVLAVALGIAYGSAELFGVSFALGAFFAGLVLSGSELSHRAASESLPLQDAFAVLFFVSVGMLFDPSILVREPLAVLAVLAVILIGKSLAAFLIVVAFGYPVGTALTVSASLAQIGEFSFILAGLGIALGLLPPEGRDLILAGAILSITLNPVAFAAVDGFLQAIGPRLRTGPLARLELSGQGRLDALQRALIAQRSHAHDGDLGLQTGELIAKFPMFADLAPGRREELLTLFKPRSAVPGERVIRKGDPADALYFLSSGAVEVSVGGERIKLHPGDFFGEMALLTGGLRTADVTAVDYCQLLTLDAADFRDFVETYPELRNRLDDVARRRDAMNRRQQHVDEATVAG